MILRFLRKITLGYKTIKSLKDIYLFIYLAAMRDLWDFSSRPGSESADQITRLPGNSP